MSEVSHSFVFKLKCLTGSREDTRRYGFAGVLEQPAVYTGLYDRTAQVFSLVKGQFQLEFTPPSGPCTLLNDYTTFVKAVCHTTLSSDGLANAKIDDKKRIVLHFSVKHGPPTTSTASQTESAPSPAPAAAEQVHQAASAVHDAATQLEHDIQAVVAETEKLGLERKAKLSELAAAQVAANAQATSWAARAATPAVGAGQADNTTITYPSARFGPPGATSPYQWSWSVPPIPPKVPLAAVPGAPASAASGKPDARFGTGLGAKRDWLKRQVELSRQKRAEMMRAELAKSEVKSEGKSTGYTPAYVDRAPAADGFKAYATTPFNKTDAGEGWTSTKTMLSNFVRDLNKHLADNFGDQAAEFELSVEDKASETKAEEIKPAEVKAESTEPQAVHWGVVCDSCQSVNIKGVRYKCKDCSNFDLCAACHDSAGSFHPGHSYQAMAKPARRSSFFRSAAAPPPFAPSFAATTVARAVNLAREAAQEVHRKANLDIAHPATCDSCQTTIKGVRHKCLNCPDYDLCAACHGAVEATHPGHNFVAIDHPSKLTLKPVPQNIVQHNNISCDGCNMLPLVGPRYKCTHPDCPDVDFCGSCVADPVARHPVSHSLLLIREPTKSKEVRASIQRAHEINGSIAQPAMVEARSSVQDVREILQSIGRSASGKSTITAAKLVPGPVPGDKTFIVDVDASELGLLDRDVHVPIAVPASTSLEEVTEQVKSALFSGEVKSAAEVEAELAASAPDTDALIREAEQEGQVEDEVAKTVEEVAKADADAEEDEKIKIEAASIADKLDARFIADVTILDESVLPAGAEFHKVWAVVNSGSKAWPVGTRLVNVGGFSRMGGEPVAFEVPAAAVGEVVDLQAELKAPEVGGRASDHWRLQDPEGKFFGHRLWVNVIVEDDASAANSASSMSSSMIAPSLNAAGKTQSSLAPSVAPPAGTTAGTATGTSTGTGASEFASVAGTEIRASELESSDEDEELSSDEDEDLNDDESSEEYVVLTDEAASSEDDF